MSHPGRGPFYGWYVAAGSIAIYFFTNGMTLFVPQNLFPRFIETFDATTGQVSLITATSLGVAALIAPFIGVIVDRAGVLRVIRTGLAVMAVCFCLYPFARSLNDLYVLHAFLALGLALARPERKVVCLNGDGSMLMTLGTLATIVGAAPLNFILFVCDNGTFEITGNQPVAGSGRVDHAALAEAAGFRNVFRFDDARDYVESLPEVLGVVGPTFVHALVKPGSEGPIARGASVGVAYLQASLAESARALRAALENDAA